MTYAYVVLIDGEHPAPHRNSLSPGASTHTPEMQLRAVFGAASVFVSSGTPTLQLHGGGIIIGDLYTRSGVPVAEGSPLTNLPSDSSVVRRLILEDYWGDYIVVQPGEDDTCTISVMRSPSPVCDLQCVYSLRNGNGFLTSDISLAESFGLYRKRIDLDYIIHRLTYPSLKASHTGLESINELLPGCTMHLRNKNFNVIQEWSPWTFVDAEMRHSDQHEAATAIRDATRMVVSAWAKHDKSILLELSGGLDSSIVAACLKDTRAAVSCNTLTTSTPGADEREYAVLIAEMLGVELLATELRYGDARFEFPLPPHLVTPVMGPLQYAIDKIMSANSDRCGANSYFSGAGGDTVFCYLTNAVPAADAFRGAGLATGIRTVQDVSLFHQCTYWKAGRLTLRKMFQSRGKQYDSDRTLLSVRLNSPEPEHHPWMSAPTKALLGDRQRIFELSGTQFYRDSCPRSQLKRFRMPLLSQPVVEACLRAPSWMWFSGGQNRAVARHAFADVLPPRILARKSKGSFAGYVGALFRRQRTLILDFLLDGELQALNLLDADKLRRIAQGEPTTRDSMVRVLQLCTLENWIRQHARST